MISKGCRFFVILSLLDSLLLSSESYCISLLKNLNFINVKIRPERRTTERGTNFFVGDFPQFFQSQILSVWNVWQRTRRYWRTHPSISNNIWWSSETILILKFGMRKTATERNELFVQDFLQFFKLSNQVFEMFKKYKRVVSSTRKCFEQRLMVIRNDLCFKFTVLSCFPRSRISNQITDDQFLGVFNFWWKIGSLSVNIKKNCSILWTTIIHENLTAVTDEVDENFDRTLNGVFN